MIKKAFWWAVKILLLATLAFHLGPFLIWLFGLVGYINAGNSYVSYVDTPSYPETLESLSKLNMRGYGERVPLKGTRPIFILEDDLNKVKRYYLSDEGHKIPYRIAGVTWPLPAYCLIIMDKDIEQEDYELVLWHEYFHCFYYGHSDEPGDIMAPMIGYTNEHSVDKYLKEIQEVYD